MGCFIPHKRQAFPVWPAPPPPGATALWTFDGTFDDINGFFPTYYIGNVTFSDDALSGQSLWSNYYGDNTWYKRETDTVPKHTFCGWFKAAIWHYVFDIFEGHTEITEIRVGETSVSFRGAHGNYGGFSFPYSLSMRWVFAGYTTAGKLFTRVLGDEIRFMHDQTGDGLSSFVGESAESILVKTHVFGTTEYMVIDQMRFFWGQELTDEQITQLAYEFD